MMITNLGFRTRILMVFHIKSTNQRLCNGLVKKIQEHVLQRGRIHADEASWRVVKSYLWVRATPDCTLF